MGAPVTALVYNISADARSISYSLIMFSFPMSSMGLIILPKMFVVRRMSQSAKEEEEEAPDRPQDSGGAEGCSNPVTQNDVTPTNNTPTRRGSGHGPRIQVVTFD